MKFAMLVVVVASLLGLGGCATGSGSSMVRADPMDARIDQEKIVAVNQWAQDHGAKLIWVTLPIKTKELVASKEGG